jgi:hypothetical protein
MPAPKETIQRTSLTTNLEARYAQSPDLANVGGGSAKDAGSPKFKATDLINNTAAGQGREWAQKEFTVNAIKGTTDFTENGLQYSTDVLKVNTNSYAPGGRVAS